MKIRILLALAALIALSLAFACGDDDSGPTQTPAEVADFPVTITDSNGQDVTLESEPDAIVALAPSFVEVLFAIGAGESIVAADENTDYPPEAEAIPKVSAYEPSVEAIAAYEPDLVLLFFDPGGLQDALSGLGIPSLFLATPADFDSVYDQWINIGLATGRAEEAATLIAETESAIFDLTDQLEGVEQGPLVFHELDSALFTIGPGSFMDEAYTLLKARNIAESTGEPYPQMSNEAVIAADPEVIVLADAEFGESPQTVAARPGWGAVSAVVNNRVYGLEEDLLSRPGPRITEGMQDLAALLYPEQFPQ
jgi:iron complex transport system substrate-binding protein